MNKKNQEENRLKDVLKSFVKSHNLQKGLDEVDAEHAWFEVMENGVDRYTKSVSLKGDCLYVALTSSVLREELSYGKEKIIELLNARLGRPLVKKIILR